MNHQLGQLAARTAGDAHLGAGTIACSDVLRDWHKETYSDEPADSSLTRHVAHDIMGHSEQASLLLSLPCFTYKGPMATLCAGMGPFMEEVGRGERTQADLPPPQ